MIGRKCQDAAGGAGAAVTGLHTGRSEAIELTIRARYRLARVWIGGGGVQTLIWRVSFLQVLHRASMKSASREMAANELRSLERPMKASSNRELGKFLKA